MWKKQSAVLSIVFCLFLLLTGVSYAKMSPGEIAKEQIQYANSYFWLGIAETGNMDSFYKALQHVQKARAALEKMPKGEDNQNLARQIDSLQEDLLGQMEVHFDTLYGVFPMIRLLVPTLFSDSLVLGTFELVDDPAVMAATSSATKLANEVLAKWNSKPQLHVVVRSNTGDDLAHKDPNPALEQEILYIFNTKPKYFTHNSQEIRQVLTPEEYQIFRKGIGTMPEAIADKLCARFGCEDLLVVSINEQDVIGNDHFYISTGKVWARGKSSPIRSFHQLGFSRDRTRYFWPVVFSFVIGVFITIFVYHRMVASRGKDRATSMVKDRSGRSQVQTHKIFGLDSHVILVPVVAYLVGRISPWIVVPMISQITPATETLFFLSFWWPCLTGLALFLIPMLIYKQIDKYLCWIDESFGIIGNGGPILVSIAMGVSFYLLVPFLLYWGMLHGAVRMTAVFLVSGYAFYQFGRVIDQTEHQVGSKTLVSYLLMTLIFFIFGGVIFFGQTFPFSSFWQIPRPWLGAALFMIPAGLLILYSMAVKDKIPDEHEREAHDSRDKPEDGPERGLASLISSIKTRDYAFWESDQFKNNIGPLVERISGTAENTGPVWLEICGPPGCGKTAAADAVIKGIEARAARPVFKYTGQFRVRTNENIADTPYEPFQDAFPEYLMAPLTASGDILEKIGDSINPVNMVPSFLGLNSFLSGIEKDSARVMDEQKQKKLFTMISGFLIEKAQQGIVIVCLDNMEQMDPSSEKLLAHLFERVGNLENIPILFMIVRREGSPDLSIGRLRQVSLKYPDKTDMKKMLMHALHLQDQTAQLICDEFTSHLAENLSAMFFYVATLAEKEILIEAEDNEFMLVPSYLSPDHPKRLPEPDTYETLVRNKLDVLDKTQVKVIAFAACMGEDFSVHLLAACMKNRDVVDILDDIESASGLVFDNIEKDGCYSFRDAATLRKIQQILGITFEGPPWPMATEKIKHIHERIGMVLQEKSQTDIQMFFDACSHFYASGLANAQKTMEACLRAADLLKKEYEFDLAGKYNKMAKDCADSKGIPMDLEEEDLLINCEKIHVQGGAGQGFDTKLAVAQRCAGYYQKNETAISDKILKVLARLCYEIARDLPSLPEKVRRKHGKEVQEFRQIGLKAAQQLLARENPDDFHYAEAHFYAGINEVNPDDAITRLTTCISLIDPLDRDSENPLDGLQAMAEDFLARKLLQQDGAGSNTEAIRLFKASIQRKRLLDDKHGLAISLGGLGRCLEQGKQFDAAKAAYKESLGFSEQTREVSGIYYRYHDLGNLYVTMAQEAPDKKREKYYKKAIVYFENGLEIIEQFDEDNKNTSRFFLSAGLFYCSAQMGAWQMYNDNGKTLFKLMQMGVGTNLSFLFSRLLQALETGRDHAGDWAGGLEEYLPLQET